MKKTLTILLVIILIVIIALPFFGNRAVELVLKDRIEVLNSFGLDIDITQTDSTYLKSKKYYNIYVKNGSKFVAYLNQFSSFELPIYIDSMLEGTKLEAEIEYSNIPLTDGVSIAIYPLKLSKSIMKNIKDNDVEFFKYFSNFLSNKGFAYYLNYNILSENFDGHIKDIEENYTLATGYKIDFKLGGVTFDGEGILIAPDKFNSKIDEISFKIDKDSEKLDILFSDISESLVFKSKTDYTIASKINRIALNAVDKDSNKSEIILDNLDFNFSTNTKNKKMDFFAKATFDKLFANAPNATIDLNGFIYDMSLTKLDKDSFELIIELIDQAKINQTPQIQDKMTENMIILLSKGLELKISDLSLSKVVVNKIEDLEGIDLKASFILPPNDILSNSQTDPVALINEIKIDIFLKISKKMFNEFSKTQPFLMMSQSFAKEENNNMVFDIKVYDGNVTVNDKAIQ